MDTPPEGNFKRAGKCRNCPSGKGTPGRPRPGSDLRDARACKPIAKGLEARLLPLQRADVGLVAMAPEPPEHLSDIVRQSAEEDLRERERKTRTETAASQFIDDLHRRQLVSGDLFGLPDECFGVRERACDPRSDVVERDHLQRLSRRNEEGELKFVGCGAEGKTGVPHFESK